MAHCGSCCETFSRVSNFDRHRSRGKCLSPEIAGLKKNSNGTWLGEDERDISGLGRLRDQAQGNCLLANDPLPISES